MRRLLSFFGGLLSGGAIGTAIALLFTPRSGDAMRDSLRQRTTNAFAAGSDAAARRRQELEAQLSEMTGPHPPGSPLNPTPPQE
ncbi:MAG: YtxH domain-containing protein [Anaerolineae bacterium]|nr:YtxH domain-containing protein [Anaerolineae bacterium]